MNKKHNQHTIKVSGNEKIQDAQREGEKGGVVTSKSCVLWYWVYGIKLSMSIWQDVSLLQILHSGPRHSQRKMYIEYTNHDTAQWRRNLWITRFFHYIEVSHIL